MSTESQEDAGAVEESDDDSAAEGGADAAGVGEPLEIDEHSAPDADADAAVEDAADTVGDAADGIDDAEWDARNGVTVHFENGEVAAYAFVVRADDEDWLYAERLAGDEDGFDEEEIEALNADAVCRITASRVHLFGDGVVHFGDDLVVDPTTLLEDSWFDADATLL